MSCRQESAERHRAELASLADEVEAKAAELEYAQVHAEALEETIRRELRDEHEAVRRRASIAVVRALRTMGHRADASVVSACASVGRRVRGCRQRTPRHWMTCAVIWLPRLLRSRR